MKQIVLAKTHAEFLNKILGTHYKGWGSSRYPYDKETWVWMVRFDGKIRSGWLNLIVSENEIHEKYVDCAPPAFKDDKRKFRIVVSVKEGYNEREYHVLGKYRYDENKSSIGCHVFLKEE